MACIVIYGGLSCIIRSVYCFATIIFETICEVLIYI